MFTGIENIIIYVSQPLFHLTKIKRMGNDYEVLQPNSTDNSQTKGKGKVGHRRFVDETEEQQ